MAEIMIAIALLCGPATTSSGLINPIADKCQKEMTACIFDIIRKTNALPSMIAPAALFSCRKNMEVK